MSLNDDDCGAAANAMWGYAAGCDVDVVGLQVQFDIFRLVKKVALNAGLPRFMVLRDAAFDVGPLSSSVVINNWPAELLAVLEQESVFHNSPMMRHVSKTTIPAVFKCADMGGLPETRDLSEAMKKHDMRECLVLPAHDVSNGRGALMLSGPSFDQDPAVVARLNLFAGLVFDRLAHFEHSDNRYGEILTPQERACVEWTAAGKTSNEIADILALSKHTVNHYLNRAADKLGTSNRTQAVAKALRLGIIK